jgi:hypothetical protein
MENIIPIKIVPIKDETKNEKYDFTNNTLTLSDNIIEKNFLYDHTGDYVVTSSTCMYDKTDKKYANYGPFTAFNNEPKQTYFLCDMCGNPQKDSATLPYPAYTQNPYAYGFDGGVCPYQGGGALLNTWSTLINGLPIRGEWLQIQIPDSASIYLFKYKISVPDNWSEPISFPKKFVVVGSNNGNDWHFLDQRNLTDEPERGVQEFNINSPDRFSYFRLIVCEIFTKKIGIIGIKQWS